MEGEIGDPISFQVDCLPTDSISFGRFEEESLSWERRSSFSHNRYLEEVKKYSRPGSVTEKKAYFEAHFKRKALLHVASSECQDEIGNQYTENDILDDMNYMGEFEDHGDEETCYMHYDETPPTVSDEHEYEMIEFEREEEESSCWEFQTDPIVANADTVLGGSGEVEPGEILQTQFGCGTLPLALADTRIEIEQKPVNDTRIEIEKKPVNETENSKLEEEQKFSNQTENSITEVELNLANESESADGLQKKTELLLKSPMDGMNLTFSTKKHQKASLNEKSTPEQKTIKTKGQTQLSVAQNSRKISNEMASLSPVKVFDKAPRKTEKESSLRTKTERRSPLKVPPTASALRKNLKLQDSENVGKVNQENISGKDLKSKKVSSSPRPAHDKGQSEGCESMSKPKRIANSRKPDSKLNSPVFSFKSDERAEKRKEFYMKLEEKLHAKEVEMNQIQARTQEETEAAIKQFRRSLNFKATPMPSFYLEAVSRSSDGKKVDTIRAKSPKMSSKSPSPGNRAGARHNSSASSKATYQQGPSSCESLIREVTECPVPCITTASSQTLSSGSNETDEMEIRNQASQAGKKTVAVKKERERGKISGIVQQRQGDSHMTGKGERVKKTRVDVGKKAMKGIIGRCSEMGRLTVHVAS